MNARSPFPQCANTSQTHRHSLVGWNTVQAQYAQLRAVAESFQRAQEFCMAQVRALTCHCRFLLCLHTTEAFNTAPHSVSHCCLKPAHSQPCTPIAFTEPPFVSESTCLSQLLTHALNMLTQTQGAPEDYYVGVLRMLEVDVPRAPRSCAFLQVRWCDLSEMSHALLAQEGRLLFSSVSHTCAHVSKLPHLKASLCLFTQTLLHTINTGRSP